MFQSFVAWGRYIYRWKNIKGVAHLKIGPIATDLGSPVSGFGWIKANGETIVNQEIYHLDRNYENIEIITLRNKHC